MNPGARSFSDGRPNCTPAMCSPCRGPRSNGRHERRPVANILFHPEAQAEYDAAIAWYQSRSLQAASHFEAEMSAILGLIGAGPETFSNYDDEHRFAVLRRFPYSVVYQVQSGQVHVVAVAHSVCRRVTGRVGLKAAFATRPGQFLAALDTVRSGAMNDQPYCDYRMTVRIEIPNQPGQFARLATLLAEEGANLGAIDIVEVGRNKMVRDITFDAQSEAHADHVVQRIRSLPGLRVRSASDRVFLLHLGGKIHTRSKVPVKTRNTLSMVYTPGVARVCRAIADDKNKAFAFTSRANTVAVVSDGCAILGLGNLGPEAAMPVMEGKIMLFKEFADIDGWPMCLATQDADDIVRVVKAVAPSFGGINLEDISAPRCFDIEDRLKAELDIPVMHDDQHGTAVVLLAALINALKVVGKDLTAIKVVVNGLGAAGTACCKILLAAGVRHLIGCDRKGAVLDATGDNLARPHARTCATASISTRRSRRCTKRCTAPTCSSVVSRGNILTVDDLDMMAADRIVFAMANPEPEIAPDQALPHCRVLATGRSRLSQSGEQPAGVSRHLPRCAGCAGTHDQRRDEARRRPRHRRHHPRRSSHRGLHRAERVREARGAGGGPAVAHAAHESGVARRREREDH